MRLAEALIQRADLLKRIEQLRHRLNQNALVQEGEQTPEDPMQLLSELHSLVAQLEALMTSINLTNAQVLDKGQSMTALLARRDCLRIKLRALREFLDAASDTALRATRGEIIVKSAVPVSQMRKEQDALSEELRELDMRIQGINWIAELT